MALALLDSHPWRLGYIQYYLAFSDIYIYTYIHITQVYNPELKSTLGLTSFRLLSGTSCVMLVRDCFPMA